MTVDPSGVGRQTREPLDARRPIHDAQLSVEVKPDVARAEHVPEFFVEAPESERASVIVTRNKPFDRWGETFGDDTVAAAMIDRLVHHADVVLLKGDSYRLRNRDLGRIPNPGEEPA